jgi:hypothetical protein
VGRAVLVALARDVLELGAVEEHVGRVGAVAAGDDDGLGARPTMARARVPASASWSASTLASGRLGVATVAPA